VHALARWAVVAERHGGEADEAGRVEHQRDAERLEQRLVEVAAAGEVGDAQVRVVDDRP
jgi:hypothetical protein